jgi:endonuclease/exonuclease/phosphatase (EEP) superfamily protein YafD
VSVLVVAAAAVGILPDLLGLDERGPFTQLVPFRPVLLGGVLVLAVLAGIAAVVRRRAVVLPVGLLVVAAVGASMVLARALADTAPASGRELTVLAFNTYEGEADVAAVAALIREDRPDLVALIEAGGRYRDRLAPLIAPLGYRLESFPERGQDVGGNTVIVGDDLGDVRVTVDSSTPFPTVEVTGGGLGNLRFVAFHSVAPKPGDTPQWRHDLGTLARWCADRGDPAIVAGDFNATLDHSVFREAIVGCTDAAEQTGEGLVATWPSNVPRWVGPQIDHVLVTGGVTAEELSVHDVPGSDHRGVLARLRLPS